MRYRIAPTKNETPVSWWDTPVSPLGHPQAIITERDTGLVDREGRKIIKGPDRIGYIKLGD